MTTSKVSTSLSRGAIVVAVLLCVLSGCTREKIALNYPPAPGVVATPGAERVRLDVVAQDKRAQFKDRVGTIRGGGKVEADNDPADFTRGAVESALRSRGFVSSAGGLVLTVELQNFYGDYSLGASASVAFTLRVRDGGRTLYSHFYEGVGTAPLGLVWNARDRIKAALEQAVADAAVKVADDRALLSVLVSARL